MPMPRNVHATAYPNLVMALHMIEKPREGSETSGPTGESAMKTD